MVERMTTIKELNNAIRIMREHCHNQSKNGRNCDVCLLHKACYEIECGGMPCFWDEIEEEEGRQDESCV